MMYPYYAYNPTSGTYVLVYGCPNTGRIYPYQTNQLTDTNYNERQQSYEYIQDPEEVDQIPESLPPNFNIQTDLPWGDIQSNIQSQYTDVYGGSLPCNIKNDAVRCLLFTVPNVPEFMMGKCQKVITRKFFGRKIKIRIGYWCLKRRRSRLNMYIEVGTRGIPSLNLKQRIQECITTSKKVAENTAYNTFLYNLPLGIGTAATKAASSALSAAFSTFNSCMIGIAAELEKIIEDVQNVEYYRNLIKNLDLKFPYEQVERTEWEPYNWRLPYTLS
jgi:hypothetical protein